MGLDSTWGGRTAELYIALDAANTWIRTHLTSYDAWELAERTGRQEAALFQATRVIDAASVWEGSRYFWNQFLEFPRAKGDYGTGSRASPDATFLNLLETDEYLRQQKLHVEQATCHQAIYLLGEEGRDTIREEQFRGITSSSRGHRFSESYGYGGSHMVLCPDAWNALAMYRGSPRLVRGGGGQLARVAG